METIIPDDPFSRISLPQVTKLNQAADSFGEQSVAVQVNVDQSPQFGGYGSTQTTKRPMVPPPDSLTTNADAATDAFIGDPIDVVGNDGKLNKVAKHSTWVTPTAYPTYLRTLTSGKSVTLDSNGLEIDNGTKSVRIYFSAFTKDIYLREIDVCDSGTPKKMLILGSDPYV